MPLPLARFIPNGVKASLRPLYRRYFQGVHQEHGSNLVVDSFGGMEFAFRRASTDQVILGNLSSYELGKLVPGYSPRSTDVVMNVGAHIGAFVLVAAKTAAKVFAVEAASDTFNFLRINKALNRADNVSLHKVAISDKDGECTLYFDTGHWGHSITKQLSTLTETVRSVKLETFFTENSIQHCDLLYFNCEGAEFPILLGASPSTLQRIGTILADCHTHLWPHNTIDDLVRHLANAGFEAGIVRGPEGSYDRVLARKK
jgi:FkbM family methyltransferase